MSPLNAFQDLFNAYVSAKDGIGTHLTQHVLDEFQDAPLIVVAGTAAGAYIPGHQPIINGLRGANPGFAELAAISHLGPAIGSLVKMAQGGGDAGVEDAERLMQKIIAVRDINTDAFWRGLGVAVWAPNIEAIQRMVAYACTLSLHYLDRFVQDPAARTPAVLVENFLESRREPFPVPFDHVMIATFTLTGLTGTANASHFLNGLLEMESVDWRKTMVVFTGGNGGAAAGLTRCTNHYLDLLHFIFADKVKPARTFFIPTPVNLDDPGVEAQLRAQWATLYGRTQLAGAMFPGYPRFVPAMCAQSDVVNRPAAVPFPPRVTSALDLYALVARLRFVMEDATQLLSSSVATYVLERLKAGTPAQDIPIPGLAYFQKQVLAAADIKAAE